MQEFSTVSALALFVAGLALFFHGLEGVASSLSLVASRSMRRHIDRLSKSWILSGVGGFLLGMVAQSATAPAFIVTGLVSSGLLSLRRGLVLVAWSNMGVVVLPFIAALNLKAGIIGVLGIGGMLATCKFGRSLLPLWRGSFMLALLMLGLEFLKEASVPIPSLPWFREIVAGVEGSLILGFLFGAVVRVVVQSTSAIVVVTVAFLHSSDFSLDQAAMLVHGTGVGVGATVLLLGRGVTGIPRQVSLFIGILNASSGSILAALLLIQESLGMPSLAEGMRSVCGIPAVTVPPLLFVVQQSLCSVIALAVGKRWVRWLAVLSPPTLQQSLQTPIHIDRLEGADPMTALELTALEQRRVVLALPDLLDGVRSGGERSAEACLGLSRSCAELGHEIHEALSLISGQTLEPPEQERLLALAARQRSLELLGEELCRFTSAVLHERRVGEERSGSKSAATRAYLVAMTEALHSILLQMARVEEKRGPLDEDALRVMTEDRSETMNAARQDILATIEAAAAPSALYVLSLLDRCVWLVRQVGSSR